MQTQECDITIFVLVVGLDLGIGQDLVQDLGQGQVLNSLGGLGVLCSITQQGL